MLTKSGLAIETGTSSGTEMERWRRRAGGERSHEIEAMGAIGTGPKTSTILLETAIGGGKKSGSGSGSRSKSARESGSDAAGALGAVAEHGGLPAQGAAAGGPYETSSSAVAHRFTICVIYVKLFVFYVKVTYALCFDICVFTVCFVLILLRFILK